MAAARLSLLEVGLWSDAAYEFESYYQFQVGSARCRGERMERVGPALISGNRCQSPAPALGSIDRFAAEIAVAQRRPCL